MMTDMDVARPARHARRSRRTSCCTSRPRPYYDAYAGSEARARALLAARLRPARPRRELGGLRGRRARRRAGRRDRRVPGGRGRRAGPPLRALTAPRMPPWRWPGAAAPPARRRARRAAARRADTLYVDALAVEPELRRRGVASALLARAEEARPRPGSPASRSTPACENDAARALYEAAGYRTREIRRAPSDAMARRSQQAGLRRVLQERVRPGARGHGQRPAPGQLATPDRQAGDPGGEAQHGDPQRQDLARTQLRAPQHPAHVNGARARGLRRGDRDQGSACRGSGPPPSPREGGR